MSAARSGLMIASALDQGSATLAASPYSLEPSWSAARGLVRAVLPGLTCCPVGWETDCAAVVARVAAGRPAPSTAEVAAHLRVASTAVAELLAVVAPAYEGAVQAIARQSREVAA